MFEMLSQKEKKEMARKKKTVVDGENTKKPFYKKWWFWVLVVLAIGAAGSGGDDTDTTADNTPKESAVAAESSSEASVSSEVESVESEVESEEVVEEEESSSEEEESVVIETPVVEFDPADYNTGLTFEDLARSPEENSFKAVTLEGTIVQVMQGDDYSQYRLAVYDDYDQMVLIEIDNSQLGTRILENDYIKIYGTFMGEYSYESTLGGVITVPAIVVDKFEFLQE